ncbi:MAG: hypothetical protein ACTTJW_02900 [Sphaerochaeta sp.]
MKKIFLGIILTAAALTALVSCNLDASDGIYSEISSSAESANVTIRAYLGKYNSEFYYLTDSGVYKYKDGSTTAVFERTDKYLIREASLNETDGAITLKKMDRQTLENTIVHNAVSGSGYTETELSGIYSHLLANGLFYDASQIYRYSSGTATPIVSGVHVEYSLETNGTAFFCVKEKATGKYKFYVIEADGAIKVGVDGSNTSYTVFQPVGTSGDYALVSYNSGNSTYNAYRLTSAGVSSSIWFTLKSALGSEKSTQAASFYYESGTGKFIYIKGSSFFDKVNITEATPSVEPVNTGFAANLRTTEITDIRQEPGETGKFIAGTSVSMLYRIEMANDTSTQLR